MNDSRKFEYDSPEIEAAMEEFFAAPDVAPLPEEKMGPEPWSQEHFEAAWAEFRSRTQEESTNA